MSKSLKPNAVIDREVDTTAIHEQELLSDSIDQAVDFVRSVSQLPNNMAAKEMDALHKLVLDSNYTFAEKREMLDRMDTISLRENAFNTHVLLACAALSLSIVIAASFCISSGR